MNHDGQFLIGEGVCPSSPASLKVGLLFHLHAAKTGFDQIDN